MGYIYTGYKNYPKSLVIVLWVFAIIVASVCIISLRNDNDSSEDTALIAFYQKTARSAKEYDADGSYAPWKAISIKNPEDFYIALGLLQHYCKDENVKDREAYVLNLDAKNVEKDSSWVYYQERPLVGNHTYKECYANQVTFIASSKSALKHSKKMVASSANNNEYIELYKYQRVIVGYVENDICKVVIMDGPDNNNVYFGYSSCFNERVSHSD